MRITPCPRGTSDEPSNVAESLNRMSGKVEDNHARAVAGVEGSPYQHSSLPGIPFTTNIHGSACPWSPEISSTVLRSSEPSADRSGDFQNRDIRPIRAKLKRPISLSRFGNENAAESRSSSPRVIAKICWVNSGSINLLVRPHL